MNQISFQNVYQTSTNRGTFKLGERATTPDGREWQFVNSTALALGSVAVPQAVTTITTVASSQDNQSRNVYITDTDSAWTTGQFEDAIGLINTGTGTGQSFKVRTNTATVLTLYPETALATAVTVAGSSGAAIISMSKVAKAAVTSKIQMAQGGAQVAFTSGDYGWILTNGDGVVVAGEALTIGGSFVTGDDTTGQVVKGTTAKGEFDEQTLGYCIVANSAADLGALVRYAVR